MTPEQLAAARDRTLADIIGPGLRVLFCGINPGLMSAWTGHHFARPGNRFWPALHASGFTPRRFLPAEQQEMPALGLGITNVAPRATARADELTREELIAGGALLTAKVETFRPAWLAVLGVTAYRVAFGDKDAQVGPQERRIGGTRIWALPSPSGLNAHWSPATLAEEFARLRAAAFADVGADGAVDVVTGDAVTGTASAAPGGVALAEADG
ncbi:G/U mismatch-specific DNA glycosylase [Actinacidiphila acididurans]|uniref:G/U mismatch-specific DNA glycosylase n=1 Tax=Actinacidiphila acididurans TaxID=2784346 RepID=A0ABS2U494_9ACTN|nr:G/U mismatch-specific DNA glycosylase [Actinacidiphila acididurans]MBM9509561.1 G/U mismatch-specific DNA glycosylase [Actinacidiphila acididurans]